LRLPVITTSSKQRAEERNRDDLEAFIEDECYEVVGEKILLADFFNKFQEWLDPADRYQWTKRKVSRSLPEKYPYGAHNSNQRYIGNLSWDDKKPTNPPFTSHNGRLVVKV